MKNCEARSKVRWGPRSMLSWHSMWKRAFLQAQCCWAWLEVVDLAPLHRHASNASSHSLVLSTAPVSICLPLIGSTSCFLFISFANLIGCLYWFNLVSFLTNACNVVHSFRWYTIWPCLNHLSHNMIIQIGHFKTLFLTSFECLTCWIFLGLTLFLFWPTHGMFFTDSGDIKFGRVFHNMVNQIGRFKKKFWTVRSSSSLMSMCGVNKCSETFASDQEDESPVASGEWFCYWSEGMLNLPLDWSFIVLYHTLCFRFNADLNTKY